MTDYQITYALLQHITRWHIVAAAHTRALRKTIRRQIAPFVA